MRRNVLYLALQVSIAGFAPAAVAQDFELGNLGDRGFRIQGANASDYSGYSVSGAGDVNGDGLADLTIGAYGVSTVGGASTGASYVVFGKSDPASVDLGGLGTGDFRIEGIDPGDRAGFRGSGAGDVNGDGVADVIIGAHSADRDDALDAGESYVVFGAPPATSVLAVRARSANGNAPRTAYGITGDGSNDATPDARAFVDFVDGQAVSGGASLAIPILTRSSGAYPEPGANVSWRLQTSRQNWNAAELRLR